MWHPSVCNGKGEVPSRNSVFGRGSGADMYSALASPNWPAAQQNLEPESNTSESRSKTGPSDLDDTNGSNWKRSSAGITTTGWAWKETSQFDCRRRVRFFSLALLISIRPVKRVFCPTEQTYDPSSTSRTSTGAILRQTAPIIQLADRKGERYAL